MITDSSLDVDSTTAVLRLGQAIRVFILHHVRSSLSPEYEKWLKRRLTHFATFVGANRPLDSITIIDLDVWYSTILERHDWSDDYKKGFAVAVKRLFSWLGSRRYIQSNPAALLVPKSVSEKPPKAISDAAAAALLELTQDNPRNHAIIKFLLRTGVRAHEASGLLRDNLHLADRYAIVIGKGKKGAKQYRPVVFDVDTAATVQLWLNIAPQSLYVFTSQKTGQTGKPILSNAIRQMIDELDEPLKQLGIVEPISPHRLRHYWGVTAARLGASESFIQQQLGHSDPKTTKRYTKFTPHILRDAYDRVFQNGR